MTSMFVAADVFCQIWGKLDLNLTSMKRWNFLPGTRKPTFLNSLKLYKVKIHLEMNCTMYNCHNCITVSLNQMKYTKVEC